jgi:hypothetical protein
MGNWSRTSEGVVHAFQGGHWGDWAFNIGEIDDGGATLHFSRGGWQEARGGGGQQIYIENIPELLDVEGEWYLNSASRVLTIAFNGTTAQDNGTLVAAQLPELIRITGSAAAAVTGVTLQGLTFAHTSTDYFLPYTVPSGGDWSFHDGGAVRLSGTSGCNVLGSVFWSPGGNALMISGFNRATVVRGNHFAYTGSSAIVSASADLGGNFDFTANPNFPEGTIIDGNLMREIGIYASRRNKPRPTYPSCHL